MQTDSIGCIATAVHLTYTGSTGYQYDNRNQLTQEVSGRAGGYSNNYAFDLVGNPTSWKGTAQTFNSANQNTQNATLTFDGNGNPAGFSGTALNWDVNDNLFAFGNVLTAGYNADGLRAWKQTAAGRTYFLYNGLMPVCEVDGSGNVTAVNTWGATGLLARFVAGTGGGNVFYCFDPQGSASVRLDAGGNVLSSHTNEAWGTQISTVATNDPYAGYGGQWGYYKDVETGLHLLGARYYDTSSGRFLNRDPIGYEGGINVYAYAGGNPISGIDPSGLQCAGMYISPLTGKYTGPTTDQMWSPSWSHAADFLTNWMLGIGEKNPHYGPNTLETISMQQSAGAAQMRAVLNRKNVNWRSTKRLNGVGTFPAFVNSISQPFNGTQAQVGGFNWKAFRKGNKMHFFIYNKTDFNSFAYHLPDYLNNQYMLNEASMGIPTGWDSNDCMATVTQQFDWWEDVPAAYRK